MKERPIIFSGDSVRAILAGKKTQTRRIMNVGNHARAQFGSLRNGVASFHDSIPDDPCPLEVRCRQGVPGDRLWVKERFFFGQAPPDDYPLIHYAANSQAFAHDGKSVCPHPEHYPSRYAGPWTSPLFMPRWASRLPLEVVNIRVERLQSITEDDAIAEGVDEISIRSVPRNATFCRRDDFAHLWEILNRKRASWDSNPWVWVVQFKRVEVVR